MKERILTFSNRLVPMLLFIAITIFHTPGLGAQNTMLLQGVVLDAQNADPLPGALLRLDDGSGMATDVQGRFRWELAATEHRLTISYLGYEPQSFLVDASALLPDTIRLNVSATSLNEILVRASPYSYQSRFKGSNHRINPGEIALINPISAEEALRTVPGVNIAGDMGLSNRPNISIRGAWGRRSQKVLLLEDGSPLAPAPYLAPGAYYAPVSDRVQAIEVYKGADILRYGPNNQHGAVNYITALPPQKPELRLRLVGGQRNYTTGLLSYGGTWNNLGALVEGVYKRFDGFTENSGIEVLNLNAKIYAKLSDNQSLYFKVSAQFEDNQASLSSITPFTFNADPFHNPFDADAFTMRRYGMDILHKWLISDRVNLISKVYASDFERDWWRQVNAVVKASEARSYLGEELFQSRYRYLQGLSPGEHDYVRVGAVVNGREATTNSRWVFQVAGIQETLQADWELFGQKHQLELGFKLHRETYSDRFLRADSSRWARSGTTVQDLQYKLWSASGYLRNEFRFGAWGITPIFRMEQVVMYRLNLLSQSQNPNLSDPKEGREYNRFQVALPGLSIDYRLPREASLFASVYRGFIAPSTRFGFLVERDGIISNPLPGEVINIPAEQSVNTELGWRGGLFNERINGQITGFWNTIDNLYLGGQNELFVELGRARVYGLEAALSSPLLQKGSHELQVQVNAALTRSTMITGIMQDTELFSQVVHSPATREEFIGRVNQNRAAYELYLRDGEGNEVLHQEASLSPNDFERLTRALVQFGEGGFRGSLPYTPELNLSLALNYSLRRLRLGAMGHYVGAQYTEFMNFASESSDGSIGQLPAFFTLDAYANYDLALRKNFRINGFINGKNITNQLFRASRLNRGSSGIFPGGFRQIIAGVTLNFG